MEYDDLKHHDPRKDTKIDEVARIHEDALDEQLEVLFRSVAAPGPSSDFVTRTLKAVRRAPLPAGRRPLRSPLAGIAGWAALVAGVAVSAGAIAVNTPVFAAVFAALLSSGITLGVWLMQAAGAGLALSDVFTTTGIAVSRVIVTREGSTALLLIAIIGATALSALQRLLVSEGAEGGVSKWQEL